MRDDRARFLAYGLTSTVNLLALLLCAFSYSFRSQAQAAVWAALGLALVCLLLATGRAMRRGRDLGWPAPLTAIGFPLSLMLMPAGLAMLVVLCIGRPSHSAARYGPPPEPSTRAALGAVLSLLWPWTLMLPFGLTV